MPIEIKDIVSKKILSEVKGYLDIGFTHSLNPYTGCAFACEYCYVREMPIQKFKDIPWGMWVDIKKNAAENYLREVSLLRRKNKPISIFMSSATDPYQPVEQRANITRSLLEEMDKNPPDSLQIQTRSPLVARDLDVLLKLKEKCQILVSMTIETDREDVKRIFSPYAPGINLRFKALKKIHDAGIHTQVSISPALPFSPNFANMIQGIADRIWIDTLLIGDGQMGMRSERLGMPKLFDANGWDKWYEKRIHLKVEKYFKARFPSEIIHVSKNNAYPF
ncbi:radical SAM protein [Paenibacillus sp. PCH8]|uniref:SPL family radical SAM protein n=1 Tax=Paenibacillus sp. PCH8 TaxID=2066524 RepID=UPI000CFA70BA|nr:radical SAM protein [Paenibacillus sp. PCH8]PQP81610.1 radical SAM protein [Paenibacillus sp. PCH8]